MKKIILALSLLVGLNSAIAQTPKFGHVNYQIVVDSIPTKLKADQDMQFFIENGQKKIEELQSLFQKDYEAYIAERETFSAMIREVKEKNLGEDQQNIAVVQERLQQDLQVFNERLYTPIENNFKEAVKIVSEKHKLNYVFEASTLMYQNGGLDITIEVKKELIKLEEERLASEK